MYATDIIDFSGKILKENEIQNCIKDLCKLVMDDNDLRKFRTDDAYLLRYLHTCAFNVPEAVKRMRSYYDLIRNHPSWFAVDPPLEMKNQIEVKDKVLLEQTDRKGRPIFIFQLGKLDVSNSNPAEQARILDEWAELFMDNPQIQATGVTGIIDMKNYPWKIVKWFSPTNAFVGSTKLHVYPVKELILHVVNTSPLLNLTIKILSPFFSENVKTMFKFHYSNWPSLHEHISPDVLPPEYGGTGPEINFERSIQNLFNHNNIISEKLEHYKVIMK